MLDVFHWEQRPRNCALKYEGDMGRSVCFSKHKSHVSEKALVTAVTKLV